MFLISFLTLHFWSVRRRHNEIFELNLSELADFYLGLVEFVEHLAQIKWEECYGRIDCKCLFNHFVQANNTVLKTKNRTASKQSNCYVKKKTHTEREHTSNDCQRCQQTQNCQNAYS